MPLPDFGNLKESDWMAACVSQVASEGKPQDQAVAICKAEWDKHQASKFEPKSKIEVLADIKKLFDKNGYQIDDDKLVALYSAFNPQTTRQRFSLSYAPIVSEENVFEIKVFPRRRVYIEKERRYLTFDSKLFQDMIANFKNEKLFKPFVDNEHQLGEKYADVLDLYEKTGGLYARVKLNDKGVDVIKNNRYSYISPEWGDRIDTEMRPHKNVLWAITLTNIPALEGLNPTLQEQIRLNRKIGGSHMTFKEKLSKLEGKVSTISLASEDSVAAMPDMINEILGMLKEAVAKIEEITGQKDVAEKTAKEVQDKLNKIESATKEAEKASFFEDAVRLGKLEAGEVEDWKGQYDKSPDFVRMMISKRPEKQTVQMTASAPASGSTKLEKLDYDIMRDQGFMKADGSYDEARYIREVKGE